MGTTLIFVGQWVSDGFRVLSNLIGLVWRRRSSWK